MKKTDLGLVVLIAAVSIGIAFLIANSFNIGVKKEGVDVKTVDQISGQVQEPSERVFNSNAINPTVEIVIGR